MDIDFKAIGKRIKIARIKADITQEQLADILNVNPSYMSHIERGKTKVSLSKLIVIANALSLPSLDIFLCDNIREHKAEFYNEAQEVLSDCDGFETRQLVTQMRENKEHMREQKSYYQSELLKQEH